MNLNSYTNRSDEEIRKANNEKYLPELRKQYAKAQLPVKPNWFIRMIVHIINIFFKD